MWAKRLSLYLVRALVFCIPVQLGIHFWPYWALLLGRRVDYLSPTVYFTDVLALLALFFWVLSLLMVKKNSARRWSKKTIVSLGLLVFVIGIVALNIGNALSWQVTLYRWMKVAVWSGVVLYIWRHPTERTQYLRALAIAAVFSSVLALTQFVLQHSVGGIFWFVGERLFAIDTPNIARSTVCTPFTQSCRLLLRPYATFAHPNILGGYLLVILFLFASLKKQIIGSVHNNSLSIMTTSGMIFVGLMTMLTMSRTVIIIGAIVFLWRYFFGGEYTKSRFMKLCVGIVLGTLIVSTLFVLPFGTHDESILTREKLNVFARTVIAEHWAFGVGLGNFVLSLAKERNLLSYVGIQPVHNVYLLAIAELGLVGFLGLMMVLMVYWTMMRNKTKRVHPDASVYVTSLMMLGVLGFFDHYLWSLQQGQLLMAVLVGLFVSAYFDRAK